MLKLAPLAALLFMGGCAAGPEQEGAPAFLTGQPVALEAVSTDGKLDCAKVDAEIARLSEVIEAKASLAMAQRGAAVAGAAAAPFTFGASAYAAMGIGLADSDTTYEREERAVLRAIRALRCEGAVYVSPVVVKH